MIGFTHYHFVAVLLNNDDFVAWELYGDCLYVSPTCTLGECVLVNDGELCEAFVFA